MVAINPNHFNMTHARRRSVLLTSWLVFLLVANVSFIWWELQHHVLDFVEAEPWVKVTLVGTAGLNLVLVGLLLLWKKWAVYALVIAAAALISVERLTTAADPLPLFALLQAAVAGVTLLLVVPKRMQFE